MFSNLWPYNVYSLFCGLTFSTVHAVVVLFIRSTVWSYVLFCITLALLSIKSTLWSYIVKFSTL